MDRFIKVEGTLLIRYFLVIIVLLNILFFIIQPYIYIYLKILILGLHI